MTLEQGRREIFSQSREKPSDIYFTGFYINQVLFPRFFTY